MKARTKHEKMIVEANKTLKPIGKRIKAWAFKNILTHNATRLKSGKISCLDCGHQWTSNSIVGWHDEVVEQKCPNCKETINVINTRNKVFNEDKLLTVLDTHKGNQVVRTFEVRGIYKAGEVSRRYVWEHSRIYITPKGKYEIIGHNRRNSWYGTGWFGDFSLKNKHSINAHTIHADGYYPKEKIIPELTKRGYEGDLHELTPWTLFNALLNDNVAESLLKIGQHSLMIHHITYSKTNVIDFWPTLKVCFKNNYYIKNANDYFDYLSDLRDYRRDLTSPRYVCPKDFHREHQRYVERKRKDRIRENIKSNFKQIRKDEKWYKKNKEQFFDLKFTKGNLTIETIKTVKEVMIIGDNFRHCIYSMNYHLKVNKLLMIATINGDMIESIDINLNTFQVNQSRGKFNRDTEYHDQIVALVTEHLKDIEKVAKKEKPSLEKRLLKKTG